MKKFLLIIIIFTSFLLFFLSLVPILSGCDDSTGPPNNSTKLNLTLEDISCTEAWMTLKSTNIQIPNNITLYINDQPNKTINLTTADTLLYIDSLLPNQTYKLKVSSIQNQESNILSNELTFTTMDTTSHNFTWQTFTFGGEKGSGVLYDVAIIDENNIWAVGEINIVDTSINGYTTYNAVHWDGSEWELKRISVDFRGNWITPILEGIFAFSASDIWFVGSLPIHGDGENWIMYDLRTTLDANISLSKVWGTSSNDIYFIGRSGSIAHYQNGRWKKIESGTELNIKDVWGININNEQIAFCVTDDKNGIKNNEIIYIQNNSIDIIVINYIVSSIWGPNKNIIYTGGFGLFKQTNNNWKEINYNSLSYVNRIRGNSSNDFFISGGFGLSAHFNGISWKIYNEVSLNAGNYYSVSMKNNIVTLIGYNYNKALIALGRRN